MSIVYETQNLLVTWDLVVLQRCGMEVMWNTDGNIIYTQYLVSRTVMQSFL
jgi:hypothetical protein